MTGTISVAGLRLYPVKSLRGHDLAEARVEGCGLAGDRRWLVVDADGRFITQREVPAMARVTVRPVEGGLRLERDDAEPLAVARPDARAGIGMEAAMVTVWRSTVPARLADAAAGAWLSVALGRPCRLAYLDDPAARAVDPDFSSPDDRVSFADGFPLLLASEASLADLNRRLDQPIPMGRFRPNLVVTGALPWDEDGWRRIRIGEATFRVVKPCSRCVVTTIDQASGDKPVPQEPLRTLATFRRAKGGVMFGQNLIPDRLGVVRLGDTVEVLEAGPSNLQAA